MYITDVIEKKKNGETLNEEEIRYFIDGYVSGELSDYQIAALLMAIWFAGMDVPETTSLTRAMAESGDQVDLSGVDGVAVDKHSTGGVADTTTLIVAPTVAACGGRIAKMSGRGLGHTGGTLDKLESIPGFRVDLDSGEFIDIVNRCGVAVVGQTGNLVPADKKLYALRDVTATVDSVPLIASSIMSKKLAAGAAGIVLDVKWGTGAFMKRPEAAVELAHLMVAIGERADRRTVALVTDMNQPLGSAVGNALDVAEAIRTLRGEEDGDLLTISIALAGELLMLGGIESEIESARSRSRRAIESGAALETLAKMIEAQHGDPSVTDEPGRLPSAEKQIIVPAESSGTIERVDAEKIGIAAQRLGAGRLRKEDAVDPAVGVVVHHRIGDAVEAGEPLFTLHVNRDEPVEEARRYCLESTTIGEGPAEKSSLIHQRIEQRG